MAWTKPGPGRGNKGNQLVHRGSTTHSVVDRAQKAADFAKLIVEDPEYRDQLKARAVSGNLHPNVETLLLYYAYGKPTENVMVQHYEDPETARELENLTEEELQRRLRMLSEAIRQGLLAEGRATMAAEAQLEAERVVVAKRVN